jgi:tetratricopeptide (TPR) repeat protein
VRTLSLEGLHARLAQRLPILTGGSRDLPARQQTLRATIAWSHDLLLTAQKQVLSRLAVFAGAFTPEAAEEVAGADLATLEALLEQNLIHRLEDGRLLLLETVRKYALERLDESGERDNARRQHALYVVELARSANVTIEADGPMRHDLVIRERDNIRAALDWAQDAGEIDLALELAALLENYWVTNSPLEARHRLGELLQRAGDAPIGLQAHALRVYASTGFTLGEYDDAKREYEASLDGYRRLGDTRGIAIVLQRLAVEELRRNSIERARELADESLRLTQRIGFAKGEAVALGVVASVKMKEGNDELALDLLERSADLCSRIGFPWWQVRALDLISQLLLQQNRLAEAEARTQEALPLLDRMGDRPGTIVAVAQLAQIAARAGRGERAGRLWGAIEAEEVRNPRGQWEAVRADHEQWVLAAAGPEFESGRANGQHLGLREATEYALASDND